jgi:RimJ/RimL family protein N-acetyltransferase
MRLESKTLTHKLARLEPFAEEHREGLVAAGADPAIWRHMPFPIEKLGYGAWFDWLMREQAAGRWMAHAVFDAFGASVGQSCYLNIRANDSGVEIGGTWYAPGAQGGPVNPACKLILMGHAFACGAERVEFKTDAENARSRAAIAKLGASFEGVHRHHMRRPDGSWRDTAWYSVLREAWPEVEAKLEARLAAFI